MAERATDSPHLLLPQAHAEPTEPVTKGWIGSLGLASLVMWMAALTPLQVLIPDQLQSIDRGGKILALGLVSAFGAVASLLATPIAGALSDRTTHAYGVGHLRGRRHRWTLAMAALSAISLALIAWQTTVLGVGILWVLFSAFQNGEYASLSAAVPDHVPVNQRATVAGWIGMPQALGLVLGRLSSCICSMAVSAATSHWPSRLCCSRCRSRWPLRTTRSSPSIASRCRSAL